MAKRSEFNKSVIEKEESVLNEFVEIIFVVLIALIVSVIFRTQVSMVRGVDGISMRPTYNNAAEYSGSGIYDTVRITRIGRVRRGDVIVFESNLKYSNGDPKILIKRVIALGGDILEFRKGDANYVQVYLNGALLDEPYIMGTAEGAPQFTGMGNYQEGQEFKVPKSCYFVMGDNRNHSQDSRLNEVGFVPFSKIEGKVYLYVPYKDNFVSALWRKVFG